MGFKFGEKSEANLSGVHPDLVKVVRQALLISPIDFSVWEGVRSTRQQAEYFVTGASKRILSRHLTGHAVDLYAFVGGKTRTDEGLYPQIAEAMRLASIDAGVPIVWGAAWRRTLDKSPSAVKAMEAYRFEQRVMGKKPFNDMVHFELPEKLYPADAAVLAKIDALVRQDISDIKDERGLA